MGFYFLLPEELLHPLIPWFSGSVCVSVGCLLITASARLTTVKPKYFCIGSRVFFSVGQVSKNM